MCPTNALLATGSTGTSRGVPPFTIPWGAITLAISHAKPPKRIEIAARLWHDCKSPRMILRAMSAMSFTKLRWPRHQTTTTEVHGT